MISKNKKTLDEFVAYCTEHPEQRMWQALRNWSGYAFVYGQPHGGEMIEDTFHKE